MEDYKLVTQRIINKGERILAEKNRRRKRMFRLALTASTVCASVCLCIGAAVMWNSVIRPELDKDTPEISISVTTRTTAVSHSEIHTESAHSTERKSMTSAPRKETEKVATSTIPVTNEYEYEEMYTEPVDEIIVTEIPTEAVQEETKAVQTTVVSQTAVVTSSEPKVSVTVAGYTDAQKNGKPIIWVGEYVYTFNGVYLTQSQVDSFYISWKEEVQIGYPDINPDKAELAEVMGLTDKDSPQEFVIVYFPKRDRYALYEAS